MPEVSTMPEQLEVVDVPHLQAFDRAKRSMKINPKDRKLTLYSYIHTYGITRALSTGDIYLVAEEMGYANKK